MNKEKNKNPININFNDFGIKKRKAAQELFKTDYGDMGITNRIPFVKEVKENKHGIDNPVIDLKTSSQKVLGAVQFDGSDVDPAVVIQIQNQSGVLPLQQEETLDEGGVLFADSTGLIVQDSINFFYDIATGELNVTSIKLHDAGTIEFTTGGVLTGGPDANNFFFEGDERLILDISGLTGEHIMNAQDNDGVVALQANPLLSELLLVFADADGLLVQDAGLYFESGALFAPDIYDAALTPGRWVLAGTDGHLEDSGDAIPDFSALTDPRTFEFQDKSGTLAMWGDDISQFNNDEGFITLADIPTLAFGTYTPTLTNVANLDGSTAYECQYMRVGGVVTVSGKVDIDPTAATTLTRLGISLPIASNIGAAEDVGGTAAATAVTDAPAGILGDVANNRAELSYICVDTTNHVMHFTFTYRVI